MGNIGSHLDLTSGRRGHQANTGMGRGNPEIGGRAAPRPGRSATRQSGSTLWRACHGGSCQSSRPGLRLMAALLPGGLRRRRRHRRCSLGFPRGRPALPLRGRYAPARGGDQDALGGCGGPLRESATGRRVAGAGRPCGFRSVGVFAVADQDGGKEVRQLTVRARYLWRRFRVRTGRPPPDSEHNMQPTVRQPGASG